MKIDFSAHKKILFAPLNWGLGHASRCMPLIDKALLEGKEVAIATDGIALNLLRKEYPGLTFFELPSYKINYAGSRLLFSLAKQSGKILKAIRAERDVLRNILVHYQADLIISDNRYGIYNSAIKSVFITHQLNPYHRFVLIRWLGRQLIKKMVSPFNEIWIPDFVDRRLSGTLSLSSKRNTKFIGPLTRIQLPKQLKSGSNILVIISGPEPRRTTFERKLFETLKGVENLVFIRGTTEVLSVDLSINGVRILDLANKAEIVKEIQEAQLVITRSGYSSIMDLYEAFINKIIIATPGQTEQEYLSEFINGKYRFYRINEDNVKTKLVSLINQLSGV